jgi:LacI family transcriptional regulator
LANGTHGRDGSDPRGAKRVAGAREAVTLRDVARAAGVHPGTASRALNETTRSLVRPETVERVVAAAGALGYKPNYLARSFKTRRTRSVGVVIPDINNPLFPPIVLGVEDRLASGGYVTLLANTQNDPDRRQRIFEGMLERRVDGLIVATARRQDPGLVEIAAQGVPIVLVNRVVEDRSFSSVSVDDAAGIRMVVEHLVELGHERIGHIAGPQSMSTGYARYQGFLASMAASGRAVEPSLVSFAESFTLAEGERCAAVLLARDERPTAIVAANDMLAIGCLTAVEAAGLRCPQDISVVGFNDMPFMDRLNPPLTTVHIPQYDLGAQAAELLIDELHHADMPLEMRLVTPSLVVRGSTAPVPAPLRAG